MERRSNKDTHRHDIDILVHIAAPSSATDDARYRAQVSALQSFQPVSRLPIHVIQHEEGSLDKDSQVEDPRTRTQSQVQDTPLSVIPDSQSQLHQQQPEVQRREIQPSQSTAAAAPPPPAKKRCLSPPSTSSPTTRDDFLDLTTLPLQSHSPPPPPSTSPFTTHLTPSLTLLASRLSLSRIYNPVSQSRDLDVLERGYWVLRIRLRSDDAAAETWSMSTLSRVWGFLQSFITEGRAGWGVWGLLERVSGAEGVLGEELCLKLYTSGEVAPHVYLLLFLATDRRVRKMAAQWRDAADEVVVQMS